MEDNLCYVCYERELSMDLNCSHKLRYSCYNILYKCPMCRKPYKCEDIFYDADEDDVSFVELLPDFLFFACVHNILFFFF